MSEILRLMRGNILVLTVCSILWRVSIDIIGPFLSLYVMALGGEYETIGQVMAVGNLASMILYPLGGYLADYQGRIKVMAYMTFVYAFTFPIFVFTSSWQWVAVGIFMQSFVTFYIPAMQALMADSIPPENRGLGYAATMAVPGAFGVASPLIGGWLIDAYGIVPAIKGLYSLGFFVALIVATLRLKYLKETLSRADGGLRINLGGVPHLLAESYRNIASTLRTAPRDLVKLGLLTSVLMFSVSLVSPFWIVRATEVIGLNTRQWGTLALAVGSINVALSFPAGRLVDRFSKRKVAGLCLIACAAPPLLFLRATSFTQVLLILAASAVPNTFINPALQSMFTDMAPREKRGRLIAALGSGGIWVTSSAWATGIVAMSSITLGTFLSGYLYRANQSMLWVILSVTVALVGLMIMVFVKEPEKAEA